jgi:hypothetical protein
MNVRSALTILASAITLTLPATRCLLAQSAPNATSPAAACGVDETSFKTKPDRSGTALTTPPAGKALVYVIEQMPQVSLFTTHVNVGVDGQWIAQLSSKTFIGFLVFPGVHHLCVEYQGQLAASDIGPTILHRLNAEAGKTYYLLYRGLISEQTQEVGFFDEVDQDEGSYVLQTSERVTSTPEKK